MRLVFLGTAGFHPNERRHTAGVFLPEVGLLFDAGTGLFRLRERLETDELDVLLSHAHLDHVVGLTYLLAPLGHGDLQAVRIHAMPETLAAVQQHLLDPAIFPVRPDFEYLPLADETAVAGGGRVTHRPLSHPGGSRGFRIDWPDRSLAYFTDTNAEPKHAKFLRGVDVLIHECYFPDGREEWAAKTGHSCTSPVARLARDAGVGRLLLTHIDPEAIGDDPIGIDAARAIFLNCEVAEDLMEVEF
ncbi:MAG: MBL fold metallo-hydrolase [Planctomycetaceae bacterium]